MLEKIKEKLSPEEFTELEKYVQGEGDKIRTKYSTEKKALEDELLKYKPKNKSEQELELEKKTKELQDKENALLQKEREYKLQETLANNNLPKELAKYLNGDDVETIGKEIGSILNQHLLNNGFKPKDHKGAYFGDIRTAYRNYPDTVSELSGHRIGIIRTPCRANKLSATLKV